MKDYKMERKVLLETLAVSYILAKENNQVWQREDSTDKMFKQGELCGACMALNLDFEESDTELIIVTQNKRKLIIRIDKTEYINKSR